MSKVTAPLLSFGASGAIAKTQVYSSWKGRPYARRYVIPGNPRSNAQTLTRREFNYLQLLVKYGTPGMLAALGAYADVLRITTANAIQRASLSRLRANKDVLPSELYDNTDLLLSPGARGAPGIPVAVITPSTDTLTVAVDDIVLPTGWTGTPVVWAAATKVWTGADYTAVPDTATIVEGSDASPTMGAYSIALAGLDGGDDYVVNTWAVFTRPDGRLAYSLADVQVATPS